MILICMLNYTPQGCQLDEFQCEKCVESKTKCLQTRTCVPASSICNGVNDCGDLSDEVGCGK